MKLPPRKSTKTARKMADGQHRELRLHEKLELLFSLEAPVAWEQYGNE